MLSLMGSVRKILVCVEVMPRPRRLCLRLGVCWCSLVNGGASMFWQRRGYTLSASSRRYRRSYVNATWLKTPILSHTHHKVKSVRHCLHHKDVIDEATRMTPGNKEVTRLCIRIMACGCLSWFVDSCNFLCCTTKMSSMKPHGMHTARRFPTLPASQRCARRRRRAALCLQQAICRTHTWNCRNIDH